jgi:hypothetical protein
MKTIRNLMLMGLLWVALLPAITSQAQTSTNLIDQAYGAGAGSFELGTYNTGAATPLSGSGGLAGGWYWSLTPGSTITGWICTTNVNWNWNRWQDVDGSKDVELGAFARLSSITPR